MSSTDFAGVDWIGRGWLLLLAFSVALLLVAALRRPCRRLFGTELAFQLWLLPPLAMLASQLPHPDLAGAAMLPSLVYMITSAAGGLPSHADGPADVGWRIAVVSAWCMGVVLCLLRATLAQWRYRRRLLGAVPMDDVSSTCQVLRAIRVDIGPALVGAWRSRIVLPADFEDRYDAGERELILAHEAMHARRRDGWWCLLAQIVAAWFWFHPLTWWATSALRHDQELACDAAVLRMHGARRRSYASAMLKTPSALLALPVGCPWSPRHPLTERIDMLKLPSPDRVRRSAGKIVGVMLFTAIAGSVYAVSTPPGQHAATAVGENQLDMKMELTADDTRASHVERITLALCMSPGKSGTVTTHGWRVDATTAPDGEDRLRIDLAVSDAGGKSIAHGRLRGTWGEPLHMEGKGEDGSHRYAFDVTPLAGCPARSGVASASAASRLVSQSAKNQSARAIAVSVASSAGLTLINPERLDSRPVTLNFDQIPAERAIQLVADVDGMKAVFEGSRVHFELK